MLIARIFVSIMLIGNYCLLNTYFLITITIFIFLL